ncbi:MAG: hypothetical protein QOD67_3674 [Caballeronia sp.]|nr:hypothetical protein [Caballeronia sp.]
MLSCLLAFYAGFPMRSIMITASCIPARERNPMRTVKLEHNDDTVLDPTDPQLAMRGSLLLDGHECGGWEQRRDGTWIARLSASGEIIVAASRDHLVERLTLVSL